MRDKNKEPNLEEDLRNSNQKSDKRILVVGGGTLAAKDLGTVLRYEFGTRYDSTEQYTEALFFMDVKRYDLIVVEPLDALCEQSPPDNNVKTAEEMYLPWKGLLRENKPWKKLVDKAAEQKVPIIVFSALPPDVLEYCGYKHDGPYAIKPEKTSRLIKLAEKALNPAA